MNFGAVHPTSRGGGLVEFLPSLGMGAAAVSGFRSFLDREVSARGAAAQFVGIAFIQPILARMSESRFAAGPFAPNEGERRFRPMLDAALSDRIAGAAHFPLTDAVARRLLGSAGPREIDLDA